MIRFASGSQIVTAVLSLVAVVCSVVQHKDLLLAEKWSPLSEASPPEFRISVSLGSDSSFVPNKQDPRTDASFRLELLKILVAPGSHQKTVGPLLRGLPSRRLFARRTRRITLRTRPQLVGVVELRL